MYDRVRHGAAFLRHHEAPGDPSVERTRPQLIEYMEMVQECEQRVGKSPDQSGRPGDLMMSDVAAIVLGLRRTTRISTNLRASRCILSRVFFIGRLCPKYEKMRRIELNCRRIWKVERIR